MTTNQAPQGTVLTDEQIDRIVDNMSGLRDCLLDPYDALRDGNDHSSLYVDLRRFARAIISASAPLKDEDAKDARLNRIAFLIGSIYCFGGFKAETANERELEKLLRENGTFWEKTSDFDAAIAAQGVKQ